MKMWFIIKNWINKKGWFHFLFGLLKSMTWENFNPIFRFNSNEIEFTWLILFKSDIAN
jgi:ribosome biogenesis protein Nip4